LWVRLVFEYRKSAGQRRGAAAGSLISRETLRNWVRQAEIDDRQRPGTSTDAAQRIAEFDQPHIHTRLGICCGHHRGRRDRSDIPSPSHRPP
jgi:transposase-like protein